MNTTKLYRQLQCWNTPLVVEDGKFVHLSARAKWLDGRCVITAREVKDATIHELPEVKYEVDLDDGWLTIIVYGPCTIPARAKVSVRVICDIAHPQWLMLLTNPEAKLAEEGML